MDDEKANSLIQFFDSHRQLVVGLNRGTFERLFKALQDESGIQDIAEIDANEVHEIQLLDLANFKSSPSTANWWKDRFALWGCGLSAFVVVFVFTIGIIAILGIIPLPR